MRTAEDLVKESEQQRDAYYENAFKRKVTAEIVKRASLLAEERKVRKEMQKLVEEVKKVKEEIKKLESMSVDQIERQIDAEDLKGRPAFFQAWDWGKGFNKTTGYFDIQAID